VPLSDPTCILRGKALFIAIGGTNGCRSCRDGHAIPDSGQNRMRPRSISTPKARRALRRFLFRRFSLGSPASRYSQAGRRRWLTP
jgi:hypothetical protein